MRPPLWVGLDTGADTMACCVVDDKGGVTLETWGSKVNRKTRTGLDGAGLLLPEDFTFGPTV